MEQIVTALVIIPITKVRDIEMIAARAANILIPAARNIIGASNKKPIILHRTHWWTCLASFCSLAHNQLHPHAQSNNLLRYQSYRIRPLAFLF